MFKNDPTVVTEHETLNQAFLISIQNYIDDRLNCWPDLLINNPIHCLEKGADPNIYLIIPSISDKPILLFAAAILIGKYDDFRFAKLLLQYGANASMPKEPSAPPLTTAMTTENLLPLQMITNKLQKTFYAQYREDAALRTIFYQVAAQTKQAYPWIYDEIKNKMASAYEILWELINEQSILARQKNQPLMVLVGETHEHVIETIINAMLLVMTEHFNISNYMIEHTQRYVLDLNESLTNNESIQDSYLLNTWSPGIAAHVLAHQLGKNIIAIDVNKKQDNTWNISEEGLSARNQGMALEASKYAFASALCIVGYKHLNGLLQESNLQKYHVFTLDLSSEKELHKLFEPDLITLVSSFLTPVDAAMLAREVCSKQERTQHQQAAYTPFRDAKYTGSASDSADVNITLLMKTLKPSS